MNDDEWALSVNKMIEDMIEEQETKTPCIKWILGKPTKEGWYLVLLEKTPGRKHWFPKEYGKPVALYFDGEMPYCGKWNEVCYHVDLNDIPVPLSW